MYHLVDGVTHRERETYKDYILRAKEYPGSRFLKLIDAKINLGRVETLPIKQQPSMRKRYEGAISILENILPEVEKFFKDAHKHAQRLDMPRPIGLIDECLPEGLPPVRKEHQMDCPKLALRPFCDPYYTDAEWQEHYSGLKCTCGLEEKSKE